MLHELLFVLSGYPGDVFIPYPTDEPRPTTFAIAANMTQLLHPTERDALNRLGHLGWIYSQLDQHISYTLAPSTTSSIYHQAYATCLNTVLGDYRDVLLKLETRLVTKQDHVGDMVPVSLITSTLARWSLFLPSLHRLTMKIQSVAPDKVLTMLINQSSTGIPELHGTIATMITHLHSVFYRQVMAWMMYGQLATTNTHFFIIPTSSATTTTQWHRHYRLNLDRFPSHLPSSMAESIFYVGKVMTTLQHTPKHHHLVMPGTMKQHHLDLLRTLQFQKDDSITQHTRHAAAVVQQIRHDTTSWLFSHVFQHQHTLATYFGSFRQVFLLGDGGLCVQWLTQLEQKQADNLMMMTTTPEHASPLQQQQWMAMLVKASIGTPSEDQLNGYTFGDDDTPPSPFLALLHTHRLTYKLQWPIDLFLGEKEIQRYSELWCVLMSLKKVQMALTHAFTTTTTTTNDDEDIDQDDMELDDTRAVWRLRSQMLFWIDTLWSHVQGNVVNRHYEQLMMACSVADVDFDQVQTAHDSYLDELARGCLALGDECTVAMVTLLKTCLAFCYQVNDNDNVATLEQSFLHDSERLFGLLSKQHQELKLAGHLNELLMRLDYNKWYSTQRYQHIPDL